MAIKELFNDARPQVLFDPRASQRIDPRFKFTRASAASYVDEQKVLRLLGANSNQPRFDHSPVTGEARGLLIEPTRTNQMTYTEKLTTGWLNTNYLKTENFATAPDGTQTATRFKPPSGLVDPGNSAYGVRTFRAISNPTDVGPGVTLTASVYIKPIVKTSTYVNPPDTAQATRDVYLIMTLEGGVGNGWFNTNTLATSSNAGYEDAGNGWFRVWFTGNTTVNDSENYLFLQMENRASGVGFDPYPDGNEEFYLWGAQVEQGSYPTSYIPCPGNTSVSRAGDLLSIESPLPSTGSIYIDARSLTSDVDNTLLSAAPASPSTDKLALAIRQPASLYNSKALVYEVDGAFKPTLPFPVPTDARERNLITYGANNYHYRSDSARYTPSSSTSVPANMTRLGIGHDVTDPTKAMTGYINAVYLWPGEITPTVAEALVRGDVDPKDADAGVFTPAAGSLAFVFNTQGTGTSGDRVVQLPLRGSTNNVLVDWGDNTSSSLIGTAASVTVNHTYSSAGIYPVQIEADDDGTNSGLENLQFYANSPADLVRVLQWGGTTTFNPTTMYRAFRDCTQMDFESGARTNLPDTSAITNWSEAFYNCASLSGSFPSFNFSAATNFANAWQGCSSLTAFPAVGDQTDGVTNFSSAWYGCSSLTGFPLINTSSGTNFTDAWRGCSSLTSFPLINTGAATNLTRAWYQCSGLASFPAINTASVTNYEGTWYACAGLTSFPLLNTAAGTNFHTAWTGCSSLTSFPLIDTSKGTNFQETWFLCSSLTSFPLLDTSLGTSFFGTWRDCSSLTSFPLINTSSGTNFFEAWYGCSGLTSFPQLNTSSGTNFSWAWQNCSSLTSFPQINTASGTNFARAWYGCSSLTSFPALSFNAATGLESEPAAYTGFRDTWRDCSSLASFPANAFDNTASTRFTNAFSGCALTAQSIENILVSINTAGTSNGDLSLDGGTNANTATWSTAANNAYIALVGRGWTISQNGTAPS